MTAHSEVDDRLVAYVDGELDEAACREIEEALAHDPAARELVAIHRQTAALLKAAFAESRYAEGGVSPLPAPAVRAPRHIGWAIAASVLLSVIGYGVGVMWPVPFTSESSKLLADIAEYHSIYSRETVHLVEADASQADHIKKWLGSRVQRDIVIPDLSTAGLTFAGARMIALEGLPVASLMYTRQDGLPIAFCIMNLKAGRDTLVEQHDGISVATWGDGGHRYVVVGEGSKRLIEDLASKVQQQI
jgi:anti-sigma factor RsiW